MADQDIVEAAKALKAAHLRADALGGDHQADVAKAYQALLDAVGGDGASSGSRGAECANDWNHHQRRGECQPGPVGVRRLREH
jgi:hypothetical protein